MSYRKQRIRDPLHNIIEFEKTQFDDLLWQLIQTQPFQRLRRIKQLGFSEMVYPGATHTRFAHSLGVLHNARRLIRIIEKLTDEYKPVRAYTALAAALLHDVGHGPFSHAFEEVGKELKIDNAQHEKVSQKLILESEIAGVLNQFHSGMSRDVADLIAKKNRDIYSAVVDSQFDADKLDYMQRDRLMTGTQTGAIDLEWLLNNLELGEGPIYSDAGEIEGYQPTFIVGPKAIPATETFVLGLFQLYPTVYLHKTTRGAEMMFKRLLLQIFKLVREDNIAATGLPTNHPLIKFANDPEDFDNAQSLDDFVIWGCLEFMREASDPIVNEMAMRLKYRRLYKAIDVRIQVEKVIPPVDPQDKKQRSLRIDVICDGIYKELKEHAKTLPLMVDKSKRVPYKTLADGYSNDSPIVVKPYSDLKDYYDLNKYSEVVNSLDTFRLLRAYYPQERTEIQTLINDVIDRNIKFVQQGGVSSETAESPITPLEQGGPPATTPEPLTASEQNPATTTSTANIE